MTVIATDKTGTLTENRMDVRSIDTADAPRALKAVSLANDADPGTGAGDPLDIGLLRYAAEHGLDVAAVRAAHPIESDRPFDSAWKFTRVTVREDGRHGQLPEGRARRCCSSDARSRPPSATRGARRPRPTRGKASASWPSPGARRDGGAATDVSGARAVLGPAAGRGAGRDRPGPLRRHPRRDDHGRPSRDRAGHRAADWHSRPCGSSPARTCGRSATPALAEALRDVHVFARVQPEQKLQLVEALQAQGEIVAMTGDGVNDAPALKRSDVGVAMGERGSDVSREVADVVLLDDNFATIVGAIEEGRSIYENIQKFLRFLFSTNLSEVLLVSGGVVLAYLLGLRGSGGDLLLPLTAAQILWINLVTDGLPALALALDRTPGVMQQPPRPHRRAAARPAVAAIHRRGGRDEGAARAGRARPRAAPSATASTEARTAAFHFMAIGQLLLTYPARHTWTNPLPNPYLHAAVIGGIVIQLLAGLYPVDRHARGRRPHPARRCGCWSGSRAALAWALAETWSRLVWRTHRRQAKVLGSGQ